MRETGGKKVAVGSTVWAWTAQRLPHPHSLERLLFCCYVWSLTSAPLSKDICTDEKRSPRAPEKVVNTRRGDKKQETGFINKGQTEGGRDRERETDRDRGGDRDKVGGLIKREREREKGKTKPSRSHRQREPDR